MLHIALPWDEGGDPLGARELDVGGVTQPAPAPRFTRTPCGPPAPPVRPGSDTQAVLAGLGLTPGEITALRDSGAIS